MIETITKKHGERNSTLHTPNSTLNENSTLNKVLKFKFKIQEYQTDAVNAVVDVFNGQPYYANIDYIRDLGKRDKHNSQVMLALSKEDEELYSDIGYKNEMVELSDKQLLENINKIQMQNDIKLSGKLIKDIGKCSIDVEMETGTGKTYVYIKTMFELNKKYGWSKFIVVVPSIAIREGVYKTFEMTEDHFMEHYGKKARYFIYDSSNLTALDSFSANNGINVMIINTQAFASSFKSDAKNKQSRIIYSERDEFLSRRPIDVIKANSPIIILDEPQKMGGKVTQSKLKTEFNPLFALNYSATHAKKHNLVYALDAIDAYNKKLVKKIEVKGFEVHNLRGTDSYLYLEDICLSPTKPPVAKLELEIKYNNKVGREIRKLDVGTDLYYISKNMEQYRDYVIADINPITATVTFTNGKVIKKGEIIGDITEHDMRRIQIRETILSHFEKEEQLYNMGIKTLSLFFIDKVDKYRKYDDDGNELLGEYGKIFEEEYIDIYNEYATLSDTPYQQYLKSINPSDTHKGYFSIDKKGKLTDGTLKKGSEFSDDISAYDLILKNKERLLSFEEPTRFIFSHSALREGWDNPNIFQICTLKHSDSQTGKRQEVGRGLRLCVDQSGNRKDFSSCGDAVHDINLLTVIASESYKDFVTDLQTDIKSVLRDRPTFATSEYFKGKYITVNGTSMQIDEKTANDIEYYLIQNEYVDMDRKITDKYKHDDLNNCLVELPDKLKPMQTEIHKLIASIYDENVFKDMFNNGYVSNLPENPLNDNFSKKEFQELWNMINHKYAYTVTFDGDELIQKAVTHINNELFVSSLRYTTTIGQQNSEIAENDITNSVAFSKNKTRTNGLNNSKANHVSYDLLGLISKECRLTRKTVYAILKGIRQDKFDMYAINPEKFIKEVIRLIKEQMGIMVVDHISYDIVAGTYKNSIFTTGKISRDYAKVYEAKKAIQNYVLTDGIVEKKFAEDLDNADEVCVYAKLPRTFKIPTPIGNYSPDWAIAFYEGKIKHIYFIAETKGSMSSLVLNSIEKSKIECTKKLFEKLFIEMSTSSVKYGQVNNYQDLLNLIRSS